MKNYKKLPIDPTPTPPPTLTRTTARCPLTRERGDDEVGVRWGGGGRRGWGYDGEGVLWGGGYFWGWGGYVGVDTLGWGDYVGGGGG